LATRSVVPLKAYRQSPIAIFARTRAAHQFDYYVNVLSEGMGRQALSLREFRPDGTGSNPELIAEVAGGDAVGFGTAATLAPSARHLRLLPFDPPLFLPTYVSWQTQRSAIVDSFAEQIGAAP
jgi:hypothetical protein